MKNSKVIRILLLAYFLVSSIEIFGIATNQQILLYIFKPLIIPILALAYIKSAIKINTYYLLALLFSFLGDVFLLFSGNKYFMLGLGSFLLAHIVYISIIKKNLESFSIKKIFLSILPFVLTFILLITILYQNLEKMLVPVIIYGFTISIFGALSLYNYLEKKSNIALILVFATVIFIASDAMIALQKFHESRSFYPIAIMVTYVIAQYLIYNYVSNSTENQKT